MENDKAYPLAKVAIRMIKEPPLYSDVPLNSPQAVVKLLADSFKDYDREVFTVVNLRPDLKPINMNIVSIGALDYAMAHPREVMKSAILSNASSILLAHNHTTGKLSPSKEDIKTTDRISQICELMGIKLTDHVIVGPGDTYYSFHENGEMPLISLQLASEPQKIKTEGMNVAETQKYKNEKQSKSNQLKEITDQLEQGVQEVFQSDSYKKLLRVMAKMPQYSINNHILIAMQTEGKATMCQSFSGWKQIGRFVKAGEKGIKIIAPTPYTIQKEMNQLDTKGKPVMDADGEPIRETKEITVNAFRIASTFDISQTDGKELPTVGVDELVGNIEGYPILMKAIQETCPVPITFESITDGAKGYYHQTEKRIAIQEGMSEIQNIKTAIHEMAHQKLHAKELTAGVADKSRNGKEVEAESVAFVVCQHYGINTSDYSFGYVAGWSNGKDTPELKASLQIIRDASSEIITKIDTKVEELTKGKEIQETVTKKQSVKEKLEAGKEKLAKTPARKQKAKGVEIV